MLTLKEVLSRRSAESQKRIARLAAAGRKEIDALLNQDSPDTDFGRYISPDAEKKNR
jgi:hypothetical protein